MSRHVFRDGEVTSIGFLVVVLALQTESACSVQVLISNRFRQFNRGDSEVTVLTMLVAPPELLFS